MQTSIVALLHGPDRPGIVARVAGWILENGGSILHADQHHDAQQGIFFQRVEWVHNDESAASERADAFHEIAVGMGMKVQTALSSDRPRVAVMVSKAGHALYELLQNWNAGDLPCEIAVVMGNHRTLEPVAISHSLPFAHTPIAKDTKATVEAQQLAILQQNDVDLIIMARYMQVLSDSFLEGCKVPVINIHHSFLPAFAGAKPYHQAHERGVKIIGATAHYATPVLDDGPIIHQAVRPVSHRKSVQDLMRMGRDLEKLVLAEAVRLHLENRILVYGNKTVVFD
ncbi:MAG: formyltetrahydrofolate deformylase [Verrucomicrobiales bacterium]|jgi:formyltetrahydrofolate deformylase